ncbi:hypothetical protein EKD04_013495 [Chloroflexales bacterium ZM16-3]|nr:hypothetical protein [Chloroflexales bacterium ZM16-3]
MSTDTTLDQLATQIGLPTALVRDLFDHGLISLSEAQHEGDLRELRRARRLRDDLELQHAAITIILRLRQRTVALQHEVTQLRSAARAAPPTPPSGAWSEAEWVILNELA